MAPQFHSQNARKKRGREWGICWYPADSAVVAADLWLSRTVRRGGFWSCCAWDSQGSEIRGQGSVRPHPADYFYCGPTGGNYLQKREGGLGFLFHVPGWGSWFPLSENPDRGHPAPGDHLRWRRLRFGSLGAGVPVEVPASPSLNQRTIQGWGTRHPRSRTCPFRRLSRRPGSDSAPSLRLTY
jgi:hypothetical protein